MLSLLEQLNPEQRLAAQTTDGPLLILAGAGTGKTRAITFRMANLISNGVAAENILAVTFTNKAAEEMQTRIADILLRAGIPPDRPWLSTFHSLCARLLRREAAAAGLPYNFAIFDDDDQLATVKLTMSRLNISDETLTPRNVLSKISHAKNHGQSAAQIRTEAFSSDGRKTADIFEAYEKLLAQSNALDFDDLLLRSAKLLKDSPNVRERWRQRFHTFTSTSIKTPTASSTIFSVCSPARSKTSASSATKISPSTAGAALTFPSFSASPAIFPPRA